MAMHLKSNNRCFGQMHRTSLAGIAAVRRVLTEARCLFLLAMLAFSLTVPASASHPYAPKSTDTWQPGELERVQVSLLSYRYFQAIDSADYRVAFGMLSAASSARLKFNAWQKSQADFKQQAGMGLRREITRITWYPSVDSDNAGRVIAAVSFSGQSASLAAHCGRLLWQRLVNGQFELLSAEQGYITRTAAKKLSTSEIKKRRAAMGCVGDDKL